MADEAVTDADRVLVGVDGSSSSIDALRYGARMAEVFDAPLEVVTTWSFPPYASPYIADSWSPEEDAKVVLDEAIASAFGASPPPLRRTILAGLPARILIEESRHCGLLVLGSRGRGGFVGMLLGSVSSACAEHAHCPVLIVHNRPPETAATPASAGNEE